MLLYRVPAFDGFIVTITQAQQSAPSLPPLPSQFSHHCSTSRGVIPVYDKYRIVVHKSTYYLYTQQNVVLTGPCGGSLISLDGVIKCVVTDKTGHELEDVRMCFCFVSILYVFPAWTTPHCCSQYTKLNEVAVTSLPSSGCKPVWRLCTRLISSALVIVFECSPVSYRAFRQKRFSLSLSKPKPLYWKWTFLERLREICAVLEFNTTLRSFGTKLVPIGSGRKTWRFLS